MWKPIQRLSGILALLCGCWGCHQGDPPPLTVVGHVNIDRYMGTWYEIARYPNWFESKKCVGVKSKYTLRDDGKVRIVNSCHHGSLDGRVHHITGVARVVDPPTNAKLKVTFFWPFSGKYWIIDLADDYCWAVVGEPRRKHLWILSRTPQLPPATYKHILASLPAKGYSPDRLIKTPQPEASSSE